MEYPVAKSEEMATFGDDIVRESICLVKPQILKRIEMISWYSAGASRHVVCWVPGWFEEMLLKYHLIQYRIRTVEVAIDHKTGQLKFKGTNKGRGNNISLSACVHLADPDSFQLLGKMIIRCMTGKGDIVVR